MVGKDRYLLKNVSLSFLEGCVVLPLLDALLWLLYSCCSEWLLICFLSIAAAVVVVLPFYCAVVATAALLVLLIRYFFLLEQKLEFWAQMVCLLILCSCRILIC